MTSPGSAIRVEEAATVDPDRRWGMAAVQLLMAGVLLLGFALRLYRLGADSLWWDELGQASVALLGGIAEGARRHQGAAPADYALTWLVLKVAHNDFAVRLPAAMLGTLTLSLTYRLGRELFNGPTGILAALLLAVAPLHLRYSQEVRFYALFTCLTVALTLALVIALRRQDWRGWAVYTILLVGCLYSHYYTVVVALGHGALILATSLFLGAVPGVNTKAWDSGKRSWRTIGWFLASCAVAALAFLPWFFYAVVEETGQAWAVPPEITWDLVNTMHASLVLGLAFDYLEGVLLWPLGVYGGLALLGLIAGFARRKTRLGALLITLLLVLSSGMVILALQWFNYFFASRQLLFLLPLYLLLVGFGAFFLVSLATSYVRSPDYRRLLQYPLALALILLLVLPLRSAIAFSYQGRRGALEEDWHGALAFITGNVRSENAIFVPGVASSQYLFYYLQDQAKELGATSNLSEIQSAAQSQHGAWILIFRPIATADLESKIEQSDALRVDFGPRLSVYYWEPGQERASLLSDALTWEPPANARALRHLAQHYQTAGLYDVAVQYLARAVALTTDDREASQLLTEQATYWRRQGNLERALDGFQQAIDRWPENGEAWVRLGEGLLADGEVQLALSALEKATGIAPDHYWAHHFLGQAYERQGLYPQAAEHFRVAAELEPTYAANFRLWGRSLAAMGDWAGAIDAYERFLELAPDSDQASVVRAELLRLRSSADSP